MKSYEELLAERDELYRNQIKIYETNDGSGEILITERGNFVPVEKYGVAMRENDKLKAERDALAARIQTAERVEKLFGESPDLTFDDCKRLFSAEIAEIKAEAYEAGFMKAKLVYKCELGYCSTDIHEWFDEWEAGKCAAKAHQDNQSGAWLKDSNVNGGKRHGGE